MAFLFLECQGFLNRRTSFRHRFELFDTRVSKAIRNQIDFMSIDVDVAIPLGKGAGGNLNKKIIEILESRGVSDERRIETIKSLLETNNHLFNHVHCLTVMQRCARQRINVLQILSLEKICEIFKKQDISVTPFDANFLSSMIYSLLLFDDNTLSIDIYLQMILRYLDHCTTPFNNRHIGCCFYGLQKFSTELTQVDILIGALVQKITELNANQTVIPLGDQELSMSLYGFRKMQYSTNVNMALHFIANRGGAKVPFKSEQAISNSLNGLQNFDESRSGVKDVLSVLLSKISKSDPKLMLAPRGVGSAFMVRFS